MADEQVTVANAYVQIMPSVKDAKSNLTDALMPAAEDAGSSAGDSIGSGILSKLSELQGPLMALGGTLLAAVGVQKIAGALMDVGTEFDEMRDTIIIGTGASGDALESLVDSAETIATTVPVSFSEAGDFVQNLNTRMGLTGDALEDVGTRVAALGELTGSAIDLDSLTGAFNQFSISGEDASAAMDYLWGVSQNTGIGFDQLTGILESSAPALQSLGFSFEESANMAGLLDQAGLDASSTMNRMSKALVELAQPGEDAATAYSRIVGEIGDYIEAGDEAAALDLATELFGTRGAAEFVAAVESGALSMEELQDASLGAGDGIMGTFEATADWPERWELIKNSVMQALEPLGSALMEGATAAMESLGEAISQIDPAVFEELGTMLGDVLVGAVGMLSDALTFLTDHREEIATFFEAIKEAIGKVIEVVGPLIEKFTEAATEIAGSIGELVGDLAAKWETIKTNVSDAWNNVKTIITNVWEGIKTGVSSAVESVKSNVSNTFSAVKSTVKSVWDGIKSAITTPINAARDAVKSAIDRIKGFFSFSIRWPHIPMPHFSVTPAGWSIGDLLKGSIPSLGISWYAEGGIIDTPTIYAAGVGERGAELVWPGYQPQLGRWAEALADAMPNDGGSVTNYYIDGAMVAADARLAAALQTVAERVTVRNRMGSVS